jgi:hypothetical protein
MTNLVDITRTKDSWPNRAFGEALLEAGVIEKFTAEKPLSDNGTTRRTDLYPERDGLGIRLEFMWRTATGRAAIANYVAGKLVNHGRLTGYLA